MSVRNVFVLGMNDFNRAKLESLRGAESCKFHSLLKLEDILDADEFPVREMLDTCVTTLREFSGSVDAVVGYMDFPVSTLLPLIAREVGLPTVSFEALLKCEHKYWSRLEQSRCIPEHVPRFALFDPFDEHALEQIGLPFPFWIKPVKSAGSWLGFRIGDEQQFQSAVDTIQRELGRFADPFNHLLEYAELPAEIAAGGGYACLAEQIISGWQFTAEGYAQKGEVHTYGIVDSIRAPNRRSFIRYQYPSRLPAHVRARAADVIARLLPHIDFDNAAFNVEFYWNRRSGRLWLLEVNTRIAQHHADLFEKVDGVSNQQVMLDVSLGRTVEMPSRKGPFRCAATFFLRHYRDAIVRRAPDQDTINRLQEEIPGAVIEPHVEEGTQLSRMVDQDSYSYIVALIYLGAENPTQLMRRYHYCLDQLAYELVDIDAA